MASAPAATRAGLGGRRVTGTAGAFRTRPPTLPVGVVRDRLDAALAGVRDRRMALVVAPAGSGKSTLLVQFGAACPVPVAWYRAEASDGRVPDLLAQLEASLTSVLGPLLGDWTSVEGAARALERLQGRPAFLAVDDLHLLAGTPAEAALERLWRYAPPELGLIVATRVPPAFDLARLRLEGAVVELGPDDLRFRAWEVERLFRDHYAQPLSPEELAHLTRRTHGWAAGLALFHLATRGKPPAERRRMLRQLGGRSQVVREYLTRNVLDDLPRELREFLVRTSALGRLSGAVCDRFLSRVGSERLLADIERRQIFVTRLDDGSYRCHELLRSFLDEMLVEEIGEGKARAEHRRAGQVLERAGAIPEAVQAYWRAEDGREAARLLGCHGEEAVDGPGEWLDALPGPLVEQSPWLMLATARHHVAAGRLGQASHEYRRAEHAFGAASAAELCRHERQSVTAWLEPTAVPTSDWSGLVRQAAAQHPRDALRQARHLPGALGGFTAGVCALLAGEVTEARSMLMDAAHDESSGPLLAAGARLAAATASFLGGQRDDADDVRWALQAADDAGLSWLAQLGQALVGPDVDATGGLSHLRDTCAAVGNEWGAALAVLVSGLAALLAGKPSSAELADASQRFRMLGGGVLAAWAEAGYALATASAGEPGASDEAARADRGARAAGSEGALVLARLAVAETSSSARRAQYRSQAMTLARELGLAVSSVSPTDERGRPTASSCGAQEETVARLQCFGRFAMAVNARTIDVAAVKPRARCLLRLLASRPGQPVHREALVEALWPDVDLASGVRGLQVAISSLRQLLEPGVSRGQSSRLRRDGDTYRLALDPDDVVDLIAFDRAVSRGRRDQVAGRDREAIEAYDAALGLYRGELLAEEGPAEWVLDERGRYRSEAAEAAAALAALRLSHGDAPGAVAAAERGLTIDRFRDPLWRLLIRACGEAGDRAAAGRAALEYREMLCDLGVADAS